jgi:dTDP-4-dehydrorhamnose reductase
MKKKIFITGGKGMLATALEDFYCQKGCKVVAPTHAELDILDFIKVKKALSSFKPNYVFHTAALHVDPCEENPELAFKLNAWASKNLAQACRDAETQLIYISSCGYFGDEKRFYSEYDPVVLKTVYAKSKFAGETLSLKECPQAFAVRPGWLFGGSTGHKKNFVYQRYSEALKNPQIKSASDKFGCPTFVCDLVAKMDEIIKTGQFGLYHVTNGFGCSRYEYVKKIVECYGLKSEVIPIDSSGFPRKADVPSCELLHNWNLKFLGLKPMPSWEDAVERYAKIMLKK